ncbi:MAG: ABC transporter ATP-binding protein [Lachnospiraceae bacterium]|nr:ABC transporter ATP-binding protein [Lachnospiraceae bacterium]MBQ2753640.1 ABC transporter ATP-binding protein [Bacillota bacterium]
MGNIKVDNVTFSYNKEEIILKDLSLDIEQGDFVCILGESGCGKSTLLRLLAGLNFPDKGELLIEGEKIKGPGLDRGVVFQDYSLYPWMTTGKNILISLQQRFPDKSKAELKKEIIDFLKQVGLEESVYNKYPNELSGGMRQRCAICRAFALNPPILLMDEPFGALDAVTRFRLQDVVKNMWSGSRDGEGGKGKSVVFVTHDVEEAMYLATKIFVLGMKPSKVIYSYEFSDKDKNKNRKELFCQPEYQKLREKLMSVLNNDIEERTKKK